jgi:putative tryptophan/tyrosine transport system substrate-binding protein
MNRREFIAGLGSAAAWPVVTRGQQTKVWRVGFLSGAPATDQTDVALVDTFRLKLQDLGYVGGKNLRLDVRHAEGDIGRLPVLAAELVALAPDVIVGGGTATIAALQRATSSIPIVMTAVADPIGSGFVKSAKPGGNITGLANLAVDLAAKSLELLHVAAPNAKRIAVLMGPSANHEPMVKEAHAAAGALGVTIIPVMAPGAPADLNDAFATMRKEDCDALVVLPRPSNMQRLVQLADESRLPAIYNFTGFVDLGGLLSYSANFAELHRQAAVYVDEILKGASPADLPVEQPTRLELQVNLKTAKALGLTIPDSIIVRADKVIE